ncbi:hypothetical protein AEAC466_18290 [Asticcacaulis sp. AC466]|uniref:hypothetical protein n=1 Tax=Asticcacaulis sp. AC466 TaxID=1282362 RepID=UPI0003C3E1CC|nr:hypothetical protein [Asticcacaulis sp. AC466]ESQ82297.1 hypothetical protein AEAC466_18290 [Asticcacaulis sp. AC466]
MQTANGARPTMGRFAQLDDAVLVYAFSHGQFMQAAHLLLLNSGGSEMDIMRAFAAVTTCTLWLTGNV